MIDWTESTFAEVSKVLHKRFEGKKFGGMWQLISLAVRMKFKHTVQNLLSTVLLFVLINNLLHRLGV